MLEAIRLLLGKLRIPSFHAAFLIEGGTRLADIAMCLVIAATVALRLMLITRRVRAAVRFRTLFKILLVELVAGDHLNAVFKCHIRLFIVDYL